MKGKTFIAGALNYGLLPGSGNLLLGSRAVGGLQTLTSIVLFGALTFFSLRGITMAIELLEGNQPPGYGANLAWLSLSLILLAVNIIWVSHTFSRLMRKENTPPPL